VVLMGLDLGMPDGDNDVEVGVLVHKRDHDKDIPRLNAARTYLRDCTLASFAMPRRAGIILCLA
jgi:hypothetical protein